MLQIGQSAGISLLKDKRHNKLFWTRIQTRKCKDCKGRGKVYEGDQCEDCYECTGNGIIQKTFLIWDKSIIEKIIEHATTLAKQGKHSLCDYFFDIIDKQTVIESWNARKIMEANYTPLDRLKRLRKEINYHKGSLDDVESEILAELDKVIKELE